MGKEDFSDREREASDTRRGSQQHGSYEGEDKLQRDGEELRSEGAHSNTGIGDEKNPIQENEEE